ncbi:MAG: bacterial Ig-like domain-containing protein, partial [Treponemataceae bacterium]|nr:bacterial Ig-like domain-containing protein [Treponemataceae bacterium]
MMKKITRIAALLAATAFLLAGFPACSDDEGDDDPTLEKIEIGIDTNTVKTTYSIDEDFDKAGITVTAKYSDGSTKDVTADATFAATTEDGEPFTTTAEGTFEVTLTATYEGKPASTTCTITVKNGGGDDDDDPENPPEEIPEGLTVAQKVTDEAVTETGWYQTKANTSGNIVQQTADGAISVNIKDTNCPTPEYILKDAMSGAVKITATFNITKAGN